MSDSGPSGETFEEYKNGEDIQLFSYGVLVFGHFGRPCLVASFGCLSLSLPTSNWQRPLHV